MIFLVVAVAVAVTLVGYGVLVYVIVRLLAENKRLVAVVTAPSPVAAHVAALDRPVVRREGDERPLRPVGA